MWFTEKYKRDMKSNGFLITFKTLVADIARNNFPRSLGTLTWLWKAAKPQSKRECPCCGYWGYFAVFGVPLRVDAMCPACRSLERHRLFYLGFLSGEMFGGHFGPLQPVLHFAPEKIIEKLLRENCANYRTADLYQTADLQLDIEAISLDDCSIGTVVVNHVLEHVKDDVALRELFRILKPGGLLISSVPVIEGWAETYENEAVRSPHDRFLHFGQNDHVRYYGRDYRDRCVGAGFSQVLEITAEGEDVVRYGLMRGEKVFVFRR